LDVNYVGNYIRPGPNSNLGRGIIVFTDTANAAYYVEGNVVEGNKAATKDNGVLFDRTEFKGKKLVQRQAKPFSAPDCKTLSAGKAFNQVLERVGATLPLRDAVDRRIVQTVRDRLAKLLIRPVRSAAGPNTTPARRPKILMATACPTIGRSNITSIQTILGCQPGPRR